MAGSEQQAYSADGFRAVLPELVETARRAGSVPAFRRALLELCDRQELEAAPASDGADVGYVVRVRDCARTLRLMLSPRSEALAHFSFVTAIRDLGLGRARPELTPAFLADAQHLFLGLLGRGCWNSLADVHLQSTALEGREAAIIRSSQLDALAAAVDARLRRYAHGLEPETIKRRQLRRRRLCRALGARAADFDDWRWQFAHVQREADAIARLVTLTDAEREAIASARRHHLPFGVTPYYLSLMDDDPEAGRDRAIRAQVLPSAGYVAGMSAAGTDRSCFDFMQEGDTSPIDLVTRRYPSICILKPYNTCPQICVYCQRNWEIRDALAPDALAQPEKIRAALAWIAAHPAIHEVLITGGDPLAMDDATLRGLLDGVAAIPSIERIRIGTRLPVTAPMRVTRGLARLLASYRLPGRRQVAVVTHVEHPYEVTPGMLTAVERLRTRGIPVFNQQVFTFFVARRFETALLRRLLARVGIEPYYTFNTKGKEETADYRVPLARLLQEQKEEARLLPGLSRTDEGVYNVPGQGKNYLRAGQHHALIALLPDGNRLYEFHPWEKNITPVTKSYLGEDVPLLGFLRRLEAIGEQTSDYNTLWYYY